MNERFKIQGHVYDLDWGTENLYWSNDIGWVDEGAATIFTTEELRGFSGLPIGSVALAWIDDNEKIHNIEPL